MPDAVAGSNLQAVKRQNRSAVLRTILAHAPVARHEVSRLTGITEAAISRIVADLVTEGCVAETGQGASAGAGRRPILLELQPGHAMVAGVDFRLTSVMVALADLSARILARAVIPFAERPNPDALFDEIAAQLRALLAAQGNDPADLSGVGIGCIGLVDHENGINRHAPHLSWYDIPVAQLLEQRLRVPAVADNRARAIAVAERLLQRGPVAADMLVLYVGWGIGTGIILRQEVYRGCCNYAGELGHISLDPNGLNCACGSVGCLETVASGSAAVREAQALVRGGLNGPAATPLIGLVQSSEINLASVLDLACKGQPECVAIVERMADSLGRGLAAMVSLLNPAVVVLTGPIIRGGDYVLGLLRSAIERYSMIARADSMPEVVISPLGEDAEIIGAACLALERFFYTPLPTAREPRGRLAEPSGARSRDETPGRQPQLRSTDERYRPLDRRGGDD